MRSERDLRSAYGLTPSEARLTLVLLGGDTLRASAERLGVQYETARTTLKRVFQKTGARRQAELMLLLARETGSRLDSQVKRVGQLKRPRFKR